MRLSCKKILQSIVVYVKVEYCQLKFSRCVLLGQFPRSLGRILWGLLTCHILLMQIKGPSQRAKKGFLDSGLNLNLEKCEYICFNGTLPKTPLQIKNTFIPSVENFRWHGLTIFKNILSLCQTAISEACKKAIWIL